VGKGTVTALRAAGEQRTSAPAAQPLSKCVWMEILDSRLFSVLTCGPSLVGEPNSEHPEPPVGCSVLHAERRRGRGANLDAWFPGPLAESHAHASFWNANAGAVAPCAIAQQPRCREGRRLLAHRVDSMPQRRSCPPTVRLQDGGGFHPVFALWEAEAGLDRWKRSDFFANAFYWQTLLHVRVAVNVGPSIRHGCHSAALSLD
jgi:hypothetical protein